MVYARDPVSSPPQAHRPPHREQKQLRLVSEIVGVTTILAIIFVSLVPISQMFLLMRRSEVGDHRGRARNP